MSLKEGASSTCNEQSSRSARFGSGKGRSGEDRTGQVRSGQVRSGCALQAPAPSRCNAASSSECSVCARGEGRETCLASLDVSGRAARRWKRIAAAEARPIEGSGRGQRGPE
jgi:hypothetical protein